jgi:hypothetical protein
MIAQYVPLVVNATYTVELWDSTFTTVISSQSTFVTTAVLQTVTFSGLTPSTVYNARLIINNGATTTTCPFANATTQPVLCLPPSGVSSSIALPIYCDTCGPAIEFSDNITVDGTYVDVSSDYLLQYSGGSFGDILSQYSDEVIDGAITDRKGISFGGRTWITNGTEILVYSNTATVPTLDATITPSILAGGIADMVYDPNLNLVFFVYNDTAIPLGAGLRRIGTVNPSTYAVTLNIAPVWSGGGYFVSRITINPVTFKKYLYCADGLIYVADNGATITTITAVPTGVVGVNFYASMAFNSANGDAWVLTGDSTSTNEIAVLNATTNAITWVNATGIGTYQPAVSSGAYIAETITYYPGYGSVGSDRMFVNYVTTAAPYDYIIQEFNATTYVNTTFLTDLAATVSQQSRLILYSEIYNKLLYVVTTSVHAYSPSSSLVDYNSTFALSFNGFNIHEDLVNKLVVLSGNVASPTDNYFWLGADTVNAVQCTEGVVDMYIGSNGPYQYNSTTLSWENMCTPSAIALSASSFQANAVFTTNVTLAALLYSADGGITWNVMTDTSGNIYGNPAVWLAGRQYTTPVGSFGLKITFTTTDNCSFESGIFFVV